MRFGFGFYEATDRFDGQSKSWFEIGGFTVCVVSALGYIRQLHYTFFFSELTVRLSYLQDLTH